MLTPVHWSTDPDMIAYNYDYMAIYQRSNGEIGMRMGNGMVARGGGECGV